MNGRHILLILAHLFRKRGSVIIIEDAVEYLSFRCRYGSPTNIRRMLTLALDNEMISRQDDSIQAEFMYDKQVLSANQTNSLENKVFVDRNIKPMV